MVCSFDLEFSLFDSYLRVFLNEISFDQKKKKKRKDKELS